MIEWLSAPNYFGNSLAQIILFFGIIVLSVIVGKVIYYIIKTRARQVTKKSESKIDDLLLHTIEKPLIFCLIMIGIGLGLNVLTISADMFSTVEIISDILITIGAVWIVINFIDAIIKLYFLPLAETTDTRLDDQIIPIASKVTKWLVIIFAVLIIASRFGYDITAILAGLGIGGLAFAFAAKETIADMFGGMSILMSKPFMVGDWVDFEGTVGEVEKVSLRHTTIRNLDKRTVTIPNSKISKSSVVNISSAPSRKIVFNLGLTYETPVKKMNKAIELITEIVNNHENCENYPIVQFSEFKDSALNLLVIYYAENDKWFAARHDINMSIKEAFEKNKIDFAYPTQMIYTAKA